MKTLSTYKVNPPTTTSGHSISITTTIFGTEEEVEYIRKNCAETIGNGLEQEYSSPLTSQFQLLNRSEFKFDKDQLKELVDGVIDEYLRKEEFADFLPHGKWQCSSDDYAICPVCKAEYSHFPQHSKFCGECGATMDGIKHV